MKREIHGLMRRLLAAGFALIGPFSGTLTAQEPAAAADSGDAGWPRQFTERHDHVLGIPAAG